MRQRALAALHRIRVWVPGYLKRCVRIDSRSLALFRILLGLLVVADVLLRSRNFSFYYDNQGVVPESIVNTTMTESFSLFHLTSDPTLIAILFAVHLLVGIQLIAGYKTRIAVIVSFLFVVSLDHHNPYVTSYADVLFRLLLFWAIFLPLGERWSIDAVHRDRSPREYVASVITLFAMVQMIMMYAVNGYHKTTNELWRSGDAAPLVLGIDEMTFLLGDFMAQFPTLLMVGGLVWFTILVASPLLLFLRGAPRYLFLSLFAVGHASFAITVRIGAFAYVALAGLTLFLQPAFWRDGRTAIGMLGFGPRFDSAVERVRSAGIAIANRVPDGGVRSDRATAIRETAYTFAVALVVINIALLIAVGGFWALSSSVDDPYDLHPNELMDGDAANNSVVHSASYSYFTQVEDTASALSIDQPDWSIFAPTPRTTDRYHIAPALTEDGERVDAFNDRQSISYDRPYEQLEKQHDTYRMRFYMNSVRRGSPDRGVTQNFMQHLCDRWEENHDTELTRINLYEIREDITKDTIVDHEDREPESRSHGQYTCSDDATRGPVSPPPF